MSDKKIEYPELTISGIKKLEGQRARMSDFSLVTGAFVSNIYYINDTNNLKDRVGVYWTSTKHIYGEMIAVNVFGKKIFNSIYDSCVACRPSLPFSCVKENATKTLTDDNGTVLYELGYRPIWAPDINTHSILKKQYKNDSLNNLDKSVVTKYQYNDKFDIEYGNLYEYNDKIYARIKANLDYSPTKLSNGLKVKNGDYVFIEVSPVYWMQNRRDEKEAITYDILTIAAPFNRNGDYNGDIKKTDFYKYLNKYFVKELFYDYSLSKKKEEFHLLKQIYLEKANHANEINKDQNKKTRRRIR